ncbi:MAG: RsfA family transcriptional regulator [Bacillaceae bacterium]
MKVRSDAWSHEEDLLLAETVLRHIREGSTQLNAFEEVGDELNRTSAACGFRWNAEIRKQYEKGIELAKKQRKELKRALAKNYTLKNTPKKVQRATKVESKQPEKSTFHHEGTTELVPVLTKDITLEDVITFLQNNYSTGVTHLQIENDMLKKENVQLNDRYQSLLQQYKKLQEQQHIIQEDYEAILNIMNRARKMVSKEETHHTMAPIFKLDQDGNLDII